MHPRQKKKSSVLLVNRLLLTLAHPLLRMFAAAAAGRAKAALVFIPPCFSDYQRETSAVGHVLLIQTE